MTTPNSQNSATLTNGITLPSSGTTPGQTGWDGSVCVISGFNTSSTNSAQDYQQALLTLLQFSDGTNTVPAGKSKTLMLDQTIPGGNTPMLGYNLLISQPNNLFPVAAVGEMASIVTGVFPAITIPDVSPQDSSTGINAFVFVQNLQAFPSSNMAQAFTTALNNASSASSGGDIDTTMNAFFAQTVNFKDVTLSAYLAAQSYVAAFAFAWANFQISYTYYVYTTGEATGSTGTGGTVSELGTITFTQKAQSGIPSLTDPTGGYTITYQPVSGSPVPLTFANGQVLTASGGDVPSICLQSIFMNKSNATGNQNDFGTIIPALAGTVFGQQAIATEYLQNLSSGQSGLQQFLQSGGWQLTMGIMNIAMGVTAMGELVGWVYGKAKGFWNGSNEPDAPNQQQVQNQEQENVQENQEALRQANPAAQVPDGQQLPDQQHGLQQQVIEENNAQQQEQAEAEIQAEANQVQNQLELENNPQVANEAQQLRQEEQVVQRIDPNDPNAGQQLQNVQQENQQIQQEIEQENQQIEQQVSKQEAEQLEREAEVEQVEVEEQEEKEKKEGEEEEDEEKGEDGGEDEMMDDV
jgi:hypothetical protein